MADPPFEVYLEYYIYEYGPAFLVICLAVALAAALILGRPEGRNRYGAVPAQVGVVDAIVTVYRKTGDFGGRAGRSELWPWLVVTLLLQGVMVVLLRHNLILAGVVAALLLIPGVAAGARRLHDLNLTARWLALALTGVGLLSLMMMWAVPSQQPHEADVSDLFE